MATLYAQSNHNWSARTGQWNTAANGSGTTQDPAAGDSLVCNNKTITIDADIGTSGGYFAALNNSGGTAGGGFSCPSDSYNIYITAITNGHATTTVANAGTGTLTFGTTTVTAGAGNGVANTSSGRVAFGTATFTGATSSTYALNNSGTGSVTIVSGTFQGNNGSSAHGFYNSSTSATAFAITSATCGAWNGSAIVNASSGSGTIETLTIAGNTSVGAVTILNSGSGTIAITTASVSPNGTTGHGISNTGVGQVKITTATLSANSGSASAISNSSTGTIIISSGTITAGSGTGYGLLNSGAGTCVVTSGVFTASTTSAAFSASTTTSTNKLSGTFVSASNGVQPVFAPKWILDTTPSNAYYKMALNGSSSYVYFYQDGAASSQSGQAAASDVRYNVTYGPTGNLTGTCYVPASASVASGVRVDNTTGTAVLTESAVRAALGMASANLDSQLGGLAAAVWNRLLTSLSTAGSIGKKLADWVLGSDSKVLLSADSQAGVTIPNVTSVATVGTLTNAPDVPAAGEIAALSAKASACTLIVRGELTSDGSTPLVFPAFFESVEVNGRMCYTEDGLVPAAQEYIAWTGAGWQLGAGGHFLGDGTENPWDAEYTAQGEATGTPVVVRISPAEQTASAVRTELAPELARAANCATVDSTGAQLAAL